jgi:hypothetical protein
MLQVPTMHQILLSRAEKEYPRASPPPLRFIRSCSSSLAAPTLHKLEAAFGVPVLEVHPRGLWVSHLHLVYFAAQTPFPGEVQLKP